MPRAPIYLVLALKELLHQKHLFTIRALGRGRDLVFAVQGWHISTSMYDKNQALFILSANKVSQTRPPLNTR